MADVRRIVNSEMRELAQDLTDQVWKARDSLLGNAFRTIMQNIDDEKSRVRYKLETLDSAEMIEEEVNESMRKLKNNTELCLQEMRAVQKILQQIIKNAEQNISKIFERD
jgi:hypothetical protein